NVHQAEHHRPRDRLRPRDAIAITQIGFVDERQLTAPAHDPLDLFVDFRRALRLPDGDGDGEFGFERLQLAAKAAPERDPPPGGRGMRSPATNSRLPGSTNSRSPPRPNPNEGSEMSFFGTRISPPRSMSDSRRSPTIFLTASWMCDL